MKKVILATSLFLGLISPSIADSMNVSIENKCVFEEKKPKKPIQFNKYYSVEEYNNNVENFNKSLTKYKKCVSDLINDINKNIDKLESFGRKSVSKAQSFDYMDYVEEDNK